MKRSILIISIILLCLCPVIHSAVDEAEIIIQESPHGITLEKVQIVYTGRKELIKFGILLKSVKIYSVEFTISNKTEFDYTNLFLKSTTYNGKGVEVEINEWDLKNQENNLFPIKANTGSVVFKKEVWFDKFRSIAKVNVAVIKATEVKPVVKEPRVEKKARVFEPADSIIQGFADFKFGMSAEECKKVDSKLIKLDELEKKVLYQRLYISKYVDGSEPLEGFEIYFMPQTEMTTYSKKRTGTDGLYDFAEDKWYFHLVFENDSLVQITLNNYFIGTGYKVHYAQKKHITYLLKEKYGKPNSDSMDFTIWIRGDAKIKYGIHTESKVYSSLVYEAKNSTWDTREQKTKETKDML